MPVSRQWGHGMTGVTIEQINARFIALWTETFGNGSAVHAPVLRAAPEPGRIVFVGLNPSLSRKGWDSVLEKARQKDLPHPLDYFRWPAPPYFEIGIAHRLEALAHEHYAFYGPHRTVRKRLGRNWTHLDLFAYRETDAPTVQRLLVANPKSFELTGFGEKQFELFEQLLEMAEPSIVVFINALASRIYGCRRKPAFDPTYGCYRVRIGDTPDVPVLFSRMLTGSGALDHFSRERLYWHIAHVLGIRYVPPEEGDNGGSADPSAR